MLRKVNNSLAVPLNYRVMAVYRNPDTTEKKQCRFMLFVRLRPGIVSYFKDRSRTGYYPGDKYTDQEPVMLRNLIKMVDKRLDDYDRVVIYDNHKHGQEKEVITITDGVVSHNLKIYSLMLGNFILPKWLQ